MGEITTQTIVNCFKRCGAVEVEMEMVEDPFSGLDADNDGSGKENDEAGETGESEDSKDDSENQETPLQEPTLLFSLIRQCHLMNACPLMMI